MSAGTAVIPNSFGMFLIVMQWICHCVQWQIDSVGVFVWALAPFFGFCFGFCCLLRFLRWRNASLAGGFAGRRFFLFGCGFWFCCFNRFADSKDLLSLYSVFSAFSHVRTEPLARHRPHSKGKKKSSSHLRLPCLFPNLAWPRVDSPSGLASQTWPCHILGSHKGSGGSACHMLTSSKAVSSTVAPAMRASGRPR